MNVLVLAAHPDDEVLGCGGTIARLAKEGSQVYIAILGEGVTSRYNKREDADKKLIEKLHSQSRKVGRHLAVKDVLQLNFPDNRFDTVPLLDIIKEVEKLIKELKPAVIYTHHSGDLNIDHQITHRTVLTAARPVKDCPVTEIYAFEIPSSTDWAFQQFEPFRPNVFIDIKETLEKKTQAMQLYESEVQKFPHPRSVEALVARARYWGSIAGLEAAEAFQLVRSIR